MLRSNIRNPPRKNYVLQETTKQELLQENVILHEALSSTLTTTPGEAEVNEEQLENMSPWLDDCNVTEMAGNAVQKDKSIRRRFFHGVNDMAHYKKKKKLKGQL